MAIINFSIINIIWFTCTINAMIGVWNLLCSKLSVPIIFPSRAVVKVTLEPEYIAAVAAPIVDMATISGTNTRPASPIVD